MRGGDKEASRALTLGCGYHFRHDQFRLSFDLEGADEITDNHQTKTNRDARQILYSRVSCFMPKLWMPASLALVFGGFAFYDGCVTALFVGHFIFECVLSG